MHRHSLRLLVAAALALGACAGTPVRKVASLDPSVPAGRAEGQRFTGLRIPLTLSAEGTPWQLATEYPPFLEQGYEEPGLRESDVFAFNPVTKSSLQISFSPADAYTRFDRRALEGLTGFAGTGMESELEEEFGKGKYTMRQGPVEFTYAGGGLGKGGKVSLLVDGKPVGEGEIPMTQAMIFSADDGADVGEDSGAPVSPDYGPVGNAFNGEVRGALLSIKDDPNNSGHLVKPEDAINAALGRH